MLIIIPFKNIPITLFSKNIGVDHDNGGKFYGLYVCYERYILIYQISQ